MLAPEDRIGPRPTKQGAVDLTGGKLFLSDPGHHTNLVNIVEKYGTENLVVWDGGRMVKYHAIIRMLLRSIHAIHQFWNQRQILSTPQLTFYVDAVDLLRKTWTSLGWKPTVWVHWICAHSTFYMATYRSISTFSSIPTEHRHQNFKMDLRHAFEGWKFKNPLLTQRWLSRVVQLDALDQGLRILRLSNSISSDEFFDQNKRRRMK